MNTIYIFSDLHGNLPALNAVINDIGIIEFDNSLKLFLGDYIDFGPYSNEVLDIIRKFNNAHYIIGNHDQYLFMKTDTLFKDFNYRDKLIAHMAWTNNAISNDNKKWIFNLPVTKKIKIDDFELLMCHGHLENTEKAFLTETIERINSKIIVTGHIHAPYFKIMNNKFIINPGSVGESLDNDNRASYSMLIIDGNKINVVNKRVSYDINTIEIELIKEMYHGKMKLLEEYEKLV